MKKKSWHYIGIPVLWRVCENFYRVLEQIRLCRDLIKAFIAWSLNQTTFNFLALHRANFLALHRANIVYLICLFRDVCYRKRQSRKFSVHVTRCLMDTNVNYYSWKLTYYGILWPNRWNGKKRIVIIYKNTRCSFQLD